MVTNIFMRMESLYRLFESVIQIFSPRLAHFFSLRDLQKAFTSKIGKLVIFQLEK